MAEHAHPSRGSLPSIEPHWIGEPETGLWCEHCALPSSWRSRVVLAPVVNPMLVVARGHYEQCVECGRSSFRRDG